MNRSILVVWFLVTPLTSCVRDAPPTTAIEWDENCEGTEAGNACISMSFYLTEDVRQDAPGDLIGVLHWAVYRGGDVGLFGPGDSPAVYEGQTTDLIDFSHSETHMIHVPNVTIRSYQVLSYLDDNMDGTDTGGDPVTFPSDAFDVKKDRRSRVDVALDWVR